MSTSTAPQMSNVPEWDLGDRLGKSLRTSGVKVQEMADYMQMS